MAGEASTGAVPAGTGAVPAGTGAVPAGAAPVPSRGSAWKRVEARTSGSFHRPFAAKKCRDENIIIFSEKLKIEILQN